MRYGPLTETVSYIVGDKMISLESLTAQLKITDLGKKKRASRKSVALGGRFHVDRSTVEIVSLRIGVKAPRGTEINWRVGKLSAYEDLNAQGRLYWFMLISHILRAVGLLDPEKEAKLDTIETACGNWRTQIRKTIGVSDTFIRSVYALCSEHRGKREAVKFILRGFCCPCVQEMLKLHSELR